MIIDGKNISERDYEIVQREYDGVIAMFYSFYDYGDSNVNEIEQDIIDHMDSEQHKDSFASFLAGYKYARKAFSGRGILE